MPGYTVYSAATGTIAKSVSCPAAEIGLHVGAGQAYLSGMYSPALYYVELGPPPTPALRTLAPDVPVQDGTVPPGGAAGQVLAKASGSDYDTGWTDTAAPARGDRLLTTASLANNATETGAAALGKSYALVRVAADRACRVRLYGTAAQRAADANRAVGVDPSGEHGVACDLVFVAGNLALDLAPMVFGTCQEAPATADIPYSVTNTSGAAAAVVVTFTRLVLEGAM